MKRRLIILVDFSAHSPNLIRYACDWCIKADAVLHLVHHTIVHAPVMADRDSKRQIADLANAEAEERLREMGDALVPPAVDVSFSVSTVRLQVMLSQLLAEPFENLVLVGLKGTGLLKKLFIGTVALEVVEQTHHVVVAMPKDVTTFDHRSIHVAVSELHPLNIPALNSFLDFIDRERTGITFFHLARANEETTGMEQQLASLAATYADRFDTRTAIYQGSDPFADIKCVIGNSTDELLIVQKGSRLFSDHLFRKFLINELVYEGKTPLVVLP